MKENCQLVPAWVEENGSEIKIVFGRSRWNEENVFYSPCYLFLPADMEVAYPLREEDIWKVKRTETAEMLHLKIDGEDYKIREFAVAEDEKTVISTVPGCQNFEFVRVTLTGQLFFEDEASGETYCYIPVSVNEILGFKKFIEDHFSFLSFGSNGTLYMRYSVCYGDEDFDIYKDSVQFNSFWKPVWSQYQKNEYNAIYQKTLFDTDEFCISDMYDCQRSISNRNLIKNNSYDKRLQRLFEECKVICRRANIQIGFVASIEINNRLRRALGRCWYIEDNTFSIDINEYLFREYCTDHGIKTVILHELCHTVIDCYDHGEKWKATAKKLEQYGYHISRFMSVNDLGIPQKLF